MHVNYARIFLSSRFQLQVAICLLVVYDFEALTKVGEEYPGMVGYILVDPTSSIENLLPPYTLRTTDNSININASLSTEKAALLTIIKSNKYIIYSRLTRSKAHLGVKLVPVNQLSLAFRGPNPIPEPQNPPASPTSSLNLIYRSFFSTPTKNNLFRQKHTHKERYKLRKICHNSNTL